MNKVIISGNMVKDMEVVVTKSGHAMGKFTIANNRRVGENDIVTFVNCSMFGEKRVEGLQKYLVKGAKVLIDGVLVINIFQYYYISIKYINGNIIYIYLTMIRF